MNIFPRDKGTYRVESRTKDESDYIVDINDLTCTCPAFLDFKTASAENPCAHLEAVLVVHHKALRMFKILHPNNP